MISSAIFFLLIKKSNRNPVPNGEKETLTPTEAETTMSPSETENVYKTEWLIVRQLEKVNLQTNLEEQLSSEEILTKYLCQNLVSGSFYTKDNKHIGLFISDFQKLNSYQSNSLFNGFFYITGRSAVISQVEPQSARLALQAGPLLIKDGKPLPLKIQNDSNERRIAVATLRDGNIAFIIVYSQKSRFRGPKLAEFPEILNKLQNETSLNFEEALNLDGGTATSFITDSVKLTELSRIGSFFCIK